MHNHTVGPFLLRAWEDQVAAILETFAELYVAMIVVAILIALLGILWLSLAERRRQKPAPKAKRAGERALSDDFLLLEESSI